MAKCVLITLLAISQLLVFKSSAQQPIVDPPSVLYVVEPSQINITCTFTGSIGDTVEWRYGSSNQPLSERNFTKGENVDEAGGTKTTVLKATKAVSSIADAGEYRCVAGSQSTTIQVIVFKVETVEETYTFNMGTASLSCTPTFTNPNVNPTKRWQRNHKDLTEFEDFATKYTIFPANHTLEIHDTERADADSYQYVFTFNDGSLNGSQEVSVDVNFYATPFVKRFEKSKNIIQGDPLELKCAIFGHPKATVTWWKGEDSMRVQVNSSDRIKFKPYGGVSDSILEIGVAEFEDKGTYMCLASIDTAQVNGSSNSTIVVRVKDKLAALWPFLGIVAEVIILCIIIFIYEKKRGKDETVDEDDTTVKGGSTNAGDSNEVRQRNVRT